MINGLSSKSKALCKYFKNHLYDQLSNKLSVSDEFLGMALNYKKYNDRYKFLQESQWWSEKKLKEYQLKQLRLIIHNAYNYVPYYKKLFDKHGLKPMDICSLKDLQKIPFLTKEIIRKNLDDFISRNFSRQDLIEITTGGTTGLPVKFYLEKGVCTAEELAFYNIVLDQIGCSLKYKIAVITGNVNVFIDKGKFWKYFLFRRCLFLSSFHMNEKYLPMYIEKLKKFNPRIIRGYPSSIYTLARFIKNNKIVYSNTPAVIICVSENLYKWQQELIKEVFQCGIVNYYGNAEKNILSYNCKHSAFHHVFPQYGIVELIDKNGKTVNKEDKKGEIVATSLINFSFPFIRYKTGDIGIFTAQKCSCGRKYPLLKNIDGRLQEHIVAKDDRLISLASFNITTIPSDVFNNVEQFQFCQEKKGEIILNLVRCATYTEKDTEYIKEKLQKRFGKDLNLNIKFVNHIPKTARGKHKYFVQKLSIKPCDIL